MSENKKALEDATDAEIVQEVAERGLFADVRELDNESPRLLEDASEQELIDALQDMECNFFADKDTLTTIYEEFRKRGDAPEVLRQYLYDKIGRTL